jgi:site-specific DNA recombinase
VIYLKTIAIYSRKSKFTDNGESVQNQIDLCKKYCTTHFPNSTFVIYEDEGYSGGNSNRPKFQQMLKDAKNNKFDVLICYRLDRISRNISDFSSIINTLESNNISFISVREQFDTSTPMGRAMMYIASVFAQLERETIAERIKDNMYQLARSGRWLGGQTPTGFKSESITYYDHEMNKKKMFKLSPIKEELDLVKTLYAKYIEFRSLTKLESWTLENKILTKNNKNFDKSSLRIILTNPVYSIADNLLYEYLKENKCDIASSKDEFDGSHGVMVYNKHDESNKTKIKRRYENEWIVSIAMHKGIVPSKEWIQVQNIIKKNHEKAPRQDTGKIGLITTLLRCGKCGSKMRVNVYRKSTGTHYYYRCLMKERSRGTRCDINNLNGLLADKSVLDELKCINIRKKSIYTKLNNNSKHYIEKPPKSYETTKSTLSKELAEYERSISNLMVQLSQNNDSVASKYIIAKIEELDKKINKVKEELRKADDDKESILIEKINIDSYMNLLNDFSSNIDTLTFEEKKKYLNQIVHKIIWDGQKLEVYILGYNSEKS